MQFATENDPTIRAKVNSTFAHRNEGSNALFFPPQPRAIPQLKRVDEGSVIQRQDQDLPGADPELPRTTFFTPDSIGISNNTDSTISFDIHIDFLPTHTRLHVFMATEQGGDYKPGAPLQIIGDPGKGGDYTVVLSSLPSRFYLRFEARSETTNINVPNIRGTCVQSLD